MCLPREDSPIFHTMERENGMIRLLFTKALKQMDYLDTFMRTDNYSYILPFDCHGSRFILDFLVYIKSSAHLWTLCICVPYGVIL